MNLRAIRTELQAALTGQGYTAYDVLPANAELPAAAVGFPTDLRYHRTGADGVELRLVVTIAVPRGDYEAAQRDLDAAVNPAGLPAAIEAHQSAEWFDAVVESASAFRHLDDPLALAVDLDLYLITP